MYPIWYDAAGQAAWNAAIRESGKMAVRLEFIVPQWADPWNWVNPSIREDIVMSLDVDQANILEGQVSIEATQTAPTRQLDITWVDVNEMFDLGSVDGYTYLSPEKMIRVWYRLETPEMAEYGGWLECPIFSGHLATIEKQGDIISLSALSKDARYLEPCIWSVDGSNKQLWKGLAVTDAIRYILGTHGEQMYRIPTYGERLPNDLLIRWNDVPWAVCQKIAQAANMVLYYDGYGDVRLIRNENTHIDFEIDGSLLVEWPQRKLDFTNLRNAVVFVYSGGKAVARNQANPLDQMYIKQWKVEIMENSNVKQYSVAMDIAQARLKLRQNATTSVGVTCLPLPHIEECVARVDTLRLLR